MANDLGQSVATAEASDLRFRTVVADPPWPINWSVNVAKRRNGRGEWARILKHDLGYQTMSIEDICAIPVRDWVEDDAHLYLWIRPKDNRAGVGIRVAEAWGFKVVSEIIWCKRSFGLGAFPRPQHEPLLVCRRGKLPFGGSRSIGSVQVWDHPRRYDGSKIHSAKPDAALDLVEQASPGPYAELFARRARLGWHYPLGDQSLGGVAA